MSGQRCPKCGNYSWDDGKCKNCGYIPKDSPRFIPLDNVDVDKLVQGLKRKREQRDRDKVSEGKNPAFTIIKETEDYILSTCPQCYEDSLFFDKRTGKSECLNKMSCPTHSLSNFLTNHLIYNRQNNETTKFQAKFYTTEQTRFKNPYLLGVKMFLANIRTWRNQYMENEYVCIDFAKEVVQRATECEIRCGLVIINFNNSNVGHAIVAFETDYGLIFIEPQSGNEEDVIIGRRYSAIAKGIEESNVVSFVEIQWNDGTITKL